MAPEDRPKMGLRERKKMKTRVTIQKNALRLFKKQGYAATTVEEIAEESEISPSTFFRYFPTKEAVVLEDDYDPFLIEAFRAQPADLSPIQAFRNAVRSGLEEMSNEEQTALQERMKLIMSIPELRAVSMNQLTETMQMVAELAAERANRDPNDVAVRTLAGAVAGAAMSVQDCLAENPGANFRELMDEALDCLEKGLPL